MAFRQPKKQPQFADLKGILAQSKTPDNPLYQTTQILIERLTQFQLVTLERITEIDNSINEAQSILNIAADKTATYHTKEDETLKLPNSVQLLAGTGITFDDSVLNKRTINSVALHYDTPLTDGDLIAADLIFAAGECIIVQVPV